MRIAKLFIATMLFACAAEAPVDDPVTRMVPDDPVAAAALDLVDSAIPPAIAGKDGWNFHQAVKADFTGDGQPERVVMTARVELVRGQPAWDDGQPWQVYVESSDSTRTYVYAQRLQLGTLSMRMSQPDSTRLPTIILLEQLPERWRIVEVHYPTASAAPRAVLQFERQIDARGEIEEP